MDYQIKCRGDNCFYYSLGELADDLAKGETKFPCGMGVLIETFAEYLRKFENDINTMENCKKCNLAGKLEEYRDILKSARFKLQTDEHKNFS